MSLYANMSSMGRFILVHWYDHECSVLVFFLFYKILRCSPDTEYYTQLIFVLPSE